MKLGCQFQLPSGIWIYTSLADDFQLLPNFILKELANPSSGETICFVADLKAQTKFLPMLQLTRDHFGAIAPSSVYRTKTFNEKVGGDYRSAHLKCWAFDWPHRVASEIERAQIRDWWKALCREFSEIGAINYYSNGFHFEIGSDINYGYKEFVVRDYRGKKGDW